MSKIGLFVKEARNLLKLKEPIIFILGNESCDLDSAVCAVSLAYFYSNTNKLPENFLIDGNRRFLPIMNIQRTNLPLKTEVTYLMRKNGIDIDDLVCCNEIPSELLDVSKFILVDHHVPTSIVKADKVIQIFDHRTLDVKNACNPSNCTVKIQDVGSCATLIANEIQAFGESFENYADVIGFLRGPIVLDTINFSESADKARPLDIQVNESIERALNLNEEERSELYNELVRARSDVSSLSALQLLSKDLKIISNDNETSKVAIPGFPILVEDYLQKENVLESLQHFGNERNCDMLVLMGMKELNTGGIRRDIGLVPLRDSDLTKQIINRLSIENREYLKLREKTNDIIRFMQGQIYEQENVKASRKQILPIVQKVLENQ